MKYAKSKITGLFVDAETADYETYRRALLVCPSCGEPVFLTAGALRPAHTRCAPKSGKIVPVKEAIVRPAFVHFSGGDHEKCDIYVRSLSPKQMQGANAIARKQRVKLFEKSFLDLLGYYPKQMKHSIRWIAHSVVEIRFAQDKDNFSEEDKRKRLELSKAIALQFKRQIASCHKLPPYLVQSYVELQEQDNPLDKFNLSASDKNTQEKFIEWAKKQLVPEEQVRLAEEAMAYLRTNSGKRVLDQVLDVACYHLLVQAATEESAYFIDLVTSNIELTELVNKLSLTIAVKAVEVIAFINFAQVLLDNRSSQLQEPPVCKSDITYSKL